ncbi:hypothetical protein GALMADRAFT_137497 [Galerina marginata CBS 339.88]|uniref:Uncharacterized protein n=1 Tax=Galerina marginata (strain CBS 339.88) TaxID=685588 RepID=A0A067T992_GALM3|nr:hypothetical protein GALMADRAFT_137497 [Galerina marginata CBS 339.88]
MVIGEEEENVPIINFFDIKRTLPTMNYEDNLDTPNYDESNEEEDADSKKIRDDELPSQSIPAPVPQSSSGDISPVRAFARLVVRKTVKGAILSEPATAAYKGEEGGTFKETWA